MVFHYSRPEILHRTYCRTLVKWQATQSGQRSTGSSTQLRGVRFGDTKDYQAQPVFHQSSTSLPAKFRTIWWGLKFGIHQILAALASFSSMWCFSGQFLNVSLINPTLTYHTHFKKGFNFNPDIEITHLQLFWIGSKMGHTSDIPFLWSFDRRYYDKPL